MGKGDEKEGVQALWGTADNGELSRSKKPDWQAVSSFSLVGRWKMQEDMEPTETRSCARYQDSRSEGNSGSAGFTLEWLQRRTLGLER